MDTLPELSGQSHLPCRDRLSMIDRPNHPVDYRAYFTCDARCHGLHSERALPRVRRSWNASPDAFRMPSGKFRRAGHRMNVVIWCSNDYLGMGQHPEGDRRHSGECATRMGTGAGGTRNIAGNNHPLVELEREPRRSAPQRSRAEPAFTSGYVSGWRPSPATSAADAELPRSWPDAWNHNSMIEGVRLQAQSRSRPTSPERHGASRAGAGGRR